MNAAPPVRPPRQPKLAAGLFLAGATSRLLPASIPLRFFGAAVASQVLAWLALLAGSGLLPRFAGGLGWTLAGLHLITLGMLAMTAIGASLQLLPVATRQPVRSLRWPLVVWWLYAPGVAAVALGMGMGQPLLLAAGASAVVVALAVYAVLLGANLVGARGMPVVVAHGWIALAALALTLATAVSLAFTYVGAPLFDRATGLALHVSFAAYGFMGMLALGLSYILVPMFALAVAPHERQGLWSCALAATALLLAGLASLGVAPQPLRVAAVLAGGVAVSLHLKLMLEALKSGMRRELGRSFRLVRISWALLVASLVAGLGVALDAPLDGLPTLFGLLLVGGWLLTFLLGMLQRIIPFLASMHKPPGKTPPRTPSSLTDDRSLALHFWCHLGALALLAIAVVAESPVVAGLAALVGTAGAVAFAAFFAILLHRMRQPPPAGKSGRSAVA